MENLKLISLRVDPETLRKIDEQAKRLNYCTRSSIINNILSAVLKCGDTGSVWRIISECYLYDKGYVIKCEKDPAVLKERHKPNYDD